MTTLAAIITKDALVMGCDSLGSVTTPMVNPYTLLDYFDEKNNFNIKVDSTGKPLLGHFSMIYDKAQHIPYNHMTHVDKLFSLEPFEMGVMITGIASIGNFTIKNLINQFKNEDHAFKIGKKSKNYTVKSIAQRLLKFVYTFYDKEYSNLNIKPNLELMLGGYDKQKHIPTVLRIYVHDNKIEETNISFGIVFGGQMTEIQRLVFGTDGFNSIKMNERCQKLFIDYRNNILKLIKDKNIELEIPDLDVSDYSLFKDNWSLDGFQANWGDFSERNAIECVKFFIEIMIKSQQFSDKLPTVGGEVHIAIITKSSGYRLLSNSKSEVQYE